MEDWQRAFFRELLQIAIVVICLVWGAFSGAICGGLLLNLLGFHESWGLIGGFVLGLVVGIFIGQRVIKIVWSRLPGDDEDD